MRILQDIGPYLALLVLLAGWLCGCHQDPSAQEAKAIKAIEDLGGKVTRDDSLPGRPVVGVTFPEVNSITNAGMKELRNFRNLRLLDIHGTGITDAGLKNLKELKGLQTLILEANDITDVGLRELKELNGLETLDLHSLKITDVGLREIKGLTALRTLDLV